MEHTYEERLEKAIEEKIQLMESKDYEFPKRFSLKDYVVVGVVALVCLGMLVIGAFI